MTTHNRGLVNKFTQKEANTVQHHKFMNFRSIGQQEYLQRVSALILKTPSIHAPNRRHKLQTFSDRKVTKSRVTQLEKDHHNSYEKKKMQLSQRTGTPIDRPGEQLIDIPLALYDNAGNAIKGPKSYTTHFIGTVNVHIMTFSLYISFIMTSVIYHILSVIIIIILNVLS